MRTTDEETVAELRDLVRRAPAPPVHLDVPGALRAGRGVRRRRVVVPAALLATTGAVAIALLPTTSGGDEVPAMETPATPVEQPVNDPLGLVNLWRVSAPGEAEDTWLRLEAGTYQLWRDCGFVEGGWEASGTAFVASDPFGFSEGCYPSPDVSVPWLREASAYRAEGDGWVLVDAQGQALAELAVDGAPEPIDTAADLYAAPPEVDDRTRALLAEPSELDDGLMPVDGEALLGRWEPPGATETGYGEVPYVEFQPDGTWSGTDGCNGGEGVWAVDAAGRLLATSGPSTLVGCGGVDVPSWVAGAARAALDGQVLVLVGPDGDRLGVLARA